MSYFPKENAPDVVIGDIFKVSSGGTPSKKKDEYFHDGNIAWIKTGDLKGRYVCKPSEAITQLGLENSSAKLFPPRTVLLAMYGATIGACSILPFEAATNQACAAILPSNDCNEVYLYYYLTFIRPSLINKGVGGAQPNISAGLIKKLKIPLPPLAEQQKIAAILDAADSLRQKDQQLIEHYTALSQSLFLEMFGDPVINSMGWEKMEFGSFINVLTDYHANGSYEVLKENVELKKTKDYALMVRTTDLEHNNFSKDVIYITKHAYEYLEKSKVYGGEIIVSKIGSAGKIFLMPHLDIPVSLGMNAFLLRFNKYLNNLFVYFLLTSKFGEIEIGKRIKGAVTKTIRKDALREISIIAPPITLQNQFAERIQGIEAQKQQAQVSLEKSENLFNSLLQRAFKGELTA